MNTEIKARKVVEKLLESFDNVAAVSEHSWVPCSPSSTAYLHKILSKRGMHATDFKEANVVLGNDVEVSFYNVEDGAHYFYEDPETNELVGPFLHFSDCLNAAKQVVT